MFLIKKIQLLPLIICLFFTQQSFAEVKVQLTTEYYQIQANTIEEMLTSVKENGPKIGRNAVWALITWDLYTEYRFKSKEGVCQLIPTSLEIVANISLPQWQDIPERSGNLQHWWTNYASFIKTHEQSHFNNVFEQAKIFEKILSTLPKRASCSTLKREFLTQKQEFLYQVNKRDRQLDRSAKSKFYSSNTLFSPLKDHTSVVFESGLMNSFIGL